MIVMKFGGTSVKNAERINNALDIASSQLHRSPVMVASAMSGITDKLQLIATNAGNGNEAEAISIYREIEERHFSVAEDLLGSDNLPGCKYQLETILEELLSIIRGLSILKEWTKRTNDAVLSFGERLSTVLIYHRALERGINAELVDARKIIVTDDHFTQAHPLNEITAERIRSIIKPEKGKLWITQGFIASTEDNLTTTLGRGGSDYSATIIGSALKAEEVQIWTDVNGIMTCDPRIVTNAKSLETISYREAQELAYFGAKVIHPSTIQPAIEMEIPVIVKNTGNPEHPGTRIVSEETEAGIKAIAFKSGITLINIVSSRMLLAYGFLRRIFEIFEKHRTSVDLISTSEVSVSMTLDDTSNLDEIEKDLSKIGRVSIETGNSIVSLVGIGVWRKPDTISKVFLQLEEIPIRMVSLGASDVNLSFVVPDESLERTVTKLHDVFLVD